MVRERTFDSTSPEATHALARELGRGLEAGTLIALSGDLGAGKTAFCRGLCAGLEVEEPISSPTYTLMHEYLGRLRVSHFDAWMEGRERAFLSDGGADRLADGGVAIVEWAERVEEFLPEPFLRVRLEHTGLESRRITLAVRGRSPALEALLEALEPPPGAAEAGP